MNVTRILLLLISIAIAIGPIGTALIIYRDNLVDLVVPPEASEVMTKLSTEKPSAAFENYEYDASSRTVTLKVSIKNPYTFNLIINSLSADVECTAHHFHLGRVYSDIPQNIPAKSTTSIEMTVKWDEGVEAHIDSDHSGQSSILVDLVQLAADVQGISVQLQSRISLSDPVPIR